ncbi:hypothetical protein NHB34_08720 [Polynucleobacter sp. MWH-UH19D]|uniref:hypothetical protein n=1 Tax=Polynucleobacter sp. MWH-UH19D TaxID=1855610 RepID=UPI003365042F
MAYLQNSQEFLDKFGDINFAGFDDPTLLTDAKVGFSIQKNYPNDIRYKPAKDKKGNPDNIAVIWAVYENRFELKGDRYIPLRFRIAVMSKYRTKNIDYDYDDPSCPTKDSVAISFSTPKPMDLDLIGSYFYDSEKDCFVDDAYKLVPGVKILVTLFEAHIDSVHLVKGIGLRSKAFVSGFITKLLDVLINSVKFLLEGCFGRTLDESLERMTYFDGYSKNSLKVTGTDFLEIAGYKASKRVIILFAVVVAIFCWMMLPVDEDTYLGNLIGSDFLLLVHSLILLVFLDNVFPKALFHLLNWLIRIRKFYINLRLRVSRKRKSKVVV